MLDEQNTDPTEKPLVVAETKGIAVASQGGAMYHAFHVSRTVKTYPIQEHELLSLNDLSGNATLWTSIGAAAVTTVISCVWSLLTEARSSAGAPTNWPAIGFMVLAALIAVASFITAAGYKKKSKTRLQKILEECDSPKQ